MKNKQVKKTFYEVLGLARESTLEDLKNNWRVTSRALHPDRNGGTGESTSAFAEASRAYAILSDAKERAKYNAQLDLMTAPCSGCGGTGATYKQKGFTARITAICSKCNGSGRI